MNRVVQFIRSAAVAAVVMLCSGLAAFAQAGGADTVQIIQSSSGRYVCCYEFIVYNRQTDTSIHISEFRLRLLSGNGRFVDGNSAAPDNWAIFQSPRSVSWTSNTADADIMPGESLSGFRVCARDTGVFRAIWETRTIDGVVSSDTVVLGCIGGSCDEAFFKTIPSSTRAVVDIDLIAGNQLGRTVNDFHLNMVTPGAEFKVDPQPLPEGWIRNRANADTLAFFTPGSGLLRLRFVENFRIEFTPAPGDSTVRIEWWTTNFGDPICRDTATIRFRLSIPDSVRTSPRSSGDSCCLDLRLKNSHVPISPLDEFSIALTTPGVRLIGDSTPAGWTRMFLSQGGDSLRYRRSDPFQPLVPGDSSVFRGLCFDNSAAATDTIRYRWQTYRLGVPVSSGTGFTICLRPLTSCDMVIARADSSFSTSQRCISLQLTNANSRGASISRLVARISNPGRARTIRSASAPVGWQVQRFGGDSVVWTGGLLLAGRSLSPFNFCVSLGDSTTADPLSIAWTTSNSQGTICSDTVRVNAIIVQSCPGVQIEETGGQNPGNCCYTMQVKNTFTLPLTRLRMQVAMQGVSFSSAMGPSPWTAGIAFPTPRIDYIGGTIQPGDSISGFTFCLDASLNPVRPLTIPILVTGFAGTDQLCTDTVWVVCSGGGEARCGTIQLLSQRDSAGVGCLYQFRVVNSRQPAGNIDGIRFRITAGAGVFGDAMADGAAAGWSTIQRDRQSVTFRGGSLAPGDSVETFTIRIDSSAGGIITLESCTMLGDEVLCCSEQAVQCATSGVEFSVAPSGFRLHENRPNPFSGVTEISYELLRAVPVTLVVRDERGLEVRRIVQGRESAGTHSFPLDISELPSGVYYYSLEAGGEVATRRMLLVK